MSSTPNFSKPRLFLASQSPRRRYLLEAIGLAFEQLTPDAEEAMVPAPSETVEQMTVANAYAKAASVLSQLAESESVVLGTDTVVVVDGVPIGKPTDREDAIRTLKKLSGRTHEVISGMALLSPRYGQRQSFDRSVVRFRPLSADDIDQYVSLREPYDKAGAYAIQGLGALFVERIEGSYTNVMGLPIEKLLLELAALVKRPVFDFFEKNT